MDTLTRVGNHRDAATALLDYDEKVNDNVLSYDGTSRVVYLINNVVYKVNLGNYIFNDLEYDNANRLRDILPAPIKIPNMTLYRVNGENVLACDYIIGEPTGECYDRLSGRHCFCEGDCLPEEVEDILNLNNITDLSYGNVIVDIFGQYWIIDLGC